MQSQTDLQRENIQLRAELAGADVSHAGNYAGLFVGATVGLSSLTVVAILVIFLVRPDKDNGALITTVLGVTMPLISILIAAAIQQVHLAVNSRLSQLVRLTATSSHAEGKLEASSKPKESS